MWCGEDMNLVDFIIEEDGIISDAVKKIDRNGKGVIFIHEQGGLKAVISDGDLRRYVLENGDLNKSIKEIANYEPRMLYLNQQSIAKEFMQEQRISVVPIVDDRKNIVKICFRDGTEVFRQMGQAVPVVIMAGGKGKRLSPYTNILPKPLIPIGEKTIIEHIIDRFKNVGCKDFLMIVNYKKNLIKAFFQENREKINFYDEEKFLGTGGGLKLVEGDISSTFFLSNCDILIDADYCDMLEQHRKSQNLITMVCAAKREVLEYGVVDVDEKNQIIGLKEKPEFAFLINTGLYILEPEVIKMISEDEFIHITDIIEKCVRDGNKVGVYKVAEESWLDMGQLDALNNMKNRLGLY